MFRDSVLAAFAWAVLTYAGAVVASPAPTPPRSGPPRAARCAGCQSRRAESFVDELSGAGLGGKYSGPEAG